MQSARGWSALLVSILILSAAMPVLALDVRFDPATKVVDLDEVFDYDIFVPASPDTFNAFELTIVYDPSKLTFIPRSPLSLQVGPLMSAACLNGFHLFSAAGDTIRITYSLLCAGVRVTGPGVIYRLRFRAPSTPVITDLRFVKARFANAGILLSPVVTPAGLVQVGDVSAVPDGPRSGVSALSPVTPNPFRAGTRLTFTAGRRGRADLRVVAPDGREVRTLFDGWVEAGTSRSLTWDGRDERGTRAPAGVYFIRLSTSDGTRATKAILLR
jgi:hypothetical protein